MPFAVQSSVCLLVPLSPCLCVPFSSSPLFACWICAVCVWCVSLFVVVLLLCCSCCVVLCVVLCVWLCLCCVLCCVFGFVCVAHTLKITVYVFIQMYMSASLFLLFDLPQWFHGFCSSQAVSSIFRYFKPCKIYKKWCSLKSRKMLATACEK